MHRCTHLRLVLILAVVILSGRSMVYAQWSQPPAADPAVEYQFAAMDAYAATNYNFNAAKPAAELGLADRVAELESALNKIKGKEAAAKQKAAGKMSAKVGGRIHVDWAAFSQSEANKVQMGDNLNGVELRRGRIGVKGGGFHVIDYKVEWDFAGNAVSAKDVYLTVNELPILGHVRVGHFKEPFSLEEMTSANYITFMERANPNVLAPNRHLGVMAFDYSQYENMTWAIGAFASESGVEAQSDHGATAVTFRMTGLPWYHEASGGRGLFHIGSGYSFRDAWDDEFLGNIRPQEAHLAKQFNALISNVDYVSEVCGELAFVYGPFSAQAEYIGAYVADTAGTAANLHSCYAYVSYFLTGEHRPYKRSTGVFTRLKPLENFFRVRGCDGYVHTGKGAWEVAARWSYLDLTDEAIHLGRWSNFTAGLNWYLNPYTRLMWNYVYSDVTPDFMPGQPDSAGQAFMMRAQVDF